MSSDRLEPSDALHAALRRRDELHRALVGFEKSLAAPAAGRQAAWLDGVRAALGGVRRAFADHIEATEGEDRLFEEVLDEAPRLAHRVDVLRAEHDTIAEEIERATAVAASVVDPEDVRRELLRVLGHLARHRQKGADLLYEVYEVDLGFSE